MDYISRNKMSGVEKLVLALAMLFEFNMTLSRIDIIQYSIMAVLLICLLFNKKLYFDKYVKTIAIFLVFGFFSILWSTSKNYTLVACLTVAKYFILLLFISNKTVRFEWYLKVLGFIGLFNAVMLIPNIDLGPLLTRGARVDPVVFGVAWASNDVGPQFAICSFALFILLRNEQRKILKISYIAIILLQLGCILILGSRQAILLFLIAIIVYVLVINANRISLKGVFGVCAVIVFTIVGIKLMMTNEILYSAIGSRFESMFNGGNSEGSDEYRLQLIQFGLQKFIERPLLGYGLDGYKYIHGVATGRYCYAHNNFVELLVDTGVVGFSIYYSLPFIVVNEMKRNDLTTKETRAFVIASVIFFLASGLFVVNYYNFNVQLLMWLAFCLSSLQEENVI